MRIDQIVISARDAEPDWTEDRAGRVLTSALDRRERRATRNRVARRAMVAASIVGVLGFVFLRGANASSASTEVEPAATTTTAVAAAETLGDAGYARD
jgi:hypothetical protein